MNHDPLANPPSAPSPNPPNFPAYFLLIGLVQGLVLWWLLDGLPDVFETRAPTALRVAAVCACFACALAVYCTHAVDGLLAGARWTSVAAFSLVFAGLGGYATWSSSVPTPWLLAQAGYGNFLLAFVFITLIAGFDFSARRWVYIRLFALAWRNGIVLGSSLLMVGLFWGVLWAGALVMRSIGIGGVEQLIQQPIFAFASSCAVFAAAFGLGLVQARMTKAIRRFLLALTAWLLPLVLLFAVMWTVSLPFTGLGSVLEKSGGSAPLWWLCALAIACASSAFQDGRVKQPFPRWLSRLTQWAWVAVVPVLLVAAWSLGLGIASDGFSVLTIWAVFAMLILAVHVLGYAVSTLHRSAWLPSIATTNVVGAVVFCVGSLALLSPVADARRMGVALHLHHMVAAYQQDPNTKIAPDFQMLASSSGCFGQAALLSLGANTLSGMKPDWAKQAQKMVELLKLRESAATRSAATAIAVRCALPGYR